MERQLDDINAFCKWSYYHDLQLETLFFLYICGALLNHLLLNALMIKAFILTFLLKTDVQTGLMIQAKIEAD